MAEEKLKTPDLLPAGEAVETMIWPGGCGQIYVYKGVVKVEVCNPASDSTLDANWLVPIGLEKVCAGQVGQLNFTTETQVRVVALTDALGAVVKPDLQQFNLNQTVAHDDR
ncbi:MAG: hypothetical protein AAFO61_06200 [Pseudomonadota bacterium]